MLKASRKALATNTCRSTEVRKLDMVVGIGCGQR
jgi:hypothetical protein